VRIDPISRVGRFTLGRGYDRDHGEREREQADDIDRRVPMVVAVQDGSDRPDLPARYRPNAVFLAHLIAMKEDFPQTRSFRREEPAIGSKAYRKIAARPRMRESGQLVSTLR